MQSKIKRKPNYDTEGMMALAWVFMGLTSIVYALTHTGISGFMGWVALVSACLLFYSNSISRFSQGHERLLQQLTSFVGQILLLVIFVVQITASAGVWDAR